MRSKFKNWWKHLSMVKPETLDELWSQAGSSDRFVYRGQPEVNLPLQSKLARDDGHVANEWNMMSAFSVAIRSFGHAPTNNLELLALAQHHGLPTRLLDVTASFGAALFFAVDGAPKRRASIVWRIDIKKLMRAASYWYRQQTGRSIRNEYDTFPSIVRVLDGKLQPVLASSEVNALLDEYMDPSSSTGARHPPLLISTPHISARISVQDASFILLDPAGKDLAQQLTCLASDDSLLGIVVSPSLRHAATKHLQTLGISRRTLFPDIDNLARHLSETHRSKA